MRLLFLSYFLCAVSISTAQDYSFDQYWKNLGPEQKPLEDRRQSANGIGPVEHIAIHPKIKGMMLASSLNGGLFYSEDGGEQWINSGSDEWHYSGCSWAAFHPKNADVWFGNSVIINDNGGPGAMGHQGGIYRTKDKGITWELVADKTSFINSDYLKVYGFRFHPNDPNRLFVFTNEGFYQTSDCLSEEIKWSRVGDVGGWIYDLNFLGDELYITQFQFGKWQVFKAPLSNMTELESISFVKEMADPIAHITLEPAGEKMLILMDYERKGDELYSYDPTSNKNELVARGQRVIFGHGRTMAVSPHDPNELLLGYATSMQMWNISEKAKQRIKGGYHVDIERIAYDPFDSLTIYIGTHGGVYKTTDHCQSWESKSKGLGIAEVEGMSVSPKDSDQIVIGCYHDGSTVRADFQGNKTYQWKNINGGDGLLPLQPDYSQAVVYTSNQFTGGGLFYSPDTGKTRSHVHAKKRLTTSGWQMAAALHPLDQKYLFFNYLVSSGDGKGNVDLARTNDPASREPVDTLTNFTETHGLEKYSVFGVFNSIYHPDKLWIYVLHFQKQEDGSIKNVHKLFRTDDCMASADEVRSSWVELEIPRQDWIGDVEPDQRKADKLYLSYVAGEASSELTDDPNGFVYYLKYSKRSFALKRQYDIGRNIPYSFTGKFNMVLDGERGAFYGTRTGVYYGDKKTLKGKRDWVKVGYGVPHCKINGLFFNAESRSLTIGAYGRGVWRYYL